MKNAPIFLLTILLTACQTSPTGRKQLALVPADQMDSMGEQAFAEMKTKIPTENGAAINANVKCVAQAITDALPEKKDWEVVVFKDDSPNAFALPGGKIGVHSGLLKVAKTDAQLGAVLGHEVGHVLAQHSRERVSEQLVAQGGLSLLDAILSQKQDSRRGVLMGALGLGAQFGVLLPHSRNQESEADVIGLDLMSKSGFDPRQSVELWKNMEAAGGGQPPEFLSTHPSHGTRMENLNSHMAEALATYEKSGRRPSCPRP